MKKVLVIILFSMFFLDCASYNRKTLLGRITDLEEKVEKLERNTFIITDAMPYMPMIEWDEGMLNDVLPERTDIEIEYDHGQYGSGTLTIADDVISISDGTVTDFSFEDELMKLIFEALEEIKVKIGLHINRSRIPIEKGERKK